MIQSREETVEVSKIIFPLSYTPDQEQLEGMIASIKGRGLIHPPLIKENFEIVVGKLRLSAIKVLDPTGFIECKVCASNLSPDEYQIESIHENLKRFNLTWQAQVLYEKELHDIRIAQHGDVRGERGGGHKVAWTLRDTAHELKMSFGLLSEDIRIAQVILANPDFSKVKDKQTAKQIIFKQLKQITQEQGVTRPISFETDVCHHGSSEIVLTAYDDCTFDACITDPPWLEYKDDKLTKDVFTLDVFKQVYRVLKQNSFLYAFVSTQDWMIYYSDLQKIGFSVQKWPLIWVKEGVLSRGTRTWEYQRDYEPVLLAVKGSPALTGNMLSSIFSCKVIPSMKLTHPNEKPPEVMKRLLDNCSYEGSLVLDPFAGSGVVLEACKNMKRRYIGIERDTKYFHQIVKRLEKV